MNPRPALIAASAVLLAGLLGAVAGALVGWLRPSESLGWSALAALPAWLALEFYLSSVSESVAGIAKPLRVVAPFGVLAGFYGAWLAVAAGA